MPPTSSPYQYFLGATILGNNPLMQKIVLVVISLTLIGVMGMRLLGKA